MPVTHRRILLALSLGAAALAITSATHAADCTNTSIGVTPLIELVGGEYLGIPGGLYPNGTNVAPLSHTLAGLAAANAIVPLAADGSVDHRDGVIVLVSIGMSNTSQEFAAFRNLVQQTSGINARLVVVNGAQGGKHVLHTADPDNDFWDVLSQRLAAAGVTEAQVQSVWLKQALAGPSGEFPASLGPLHQGLRATVQNIKSKMPNVRVCHLSSRIYGGYADGPLNPEPYAYEGAFAVRMLLADQIGGDPALNHDPEHGPVLAPWLAWGPYLWADGLTPRFDGLIWECADFAPDGVHPSQSGRRKVAQMLLDFYMSHPTATPWFRDVHPADLNGDGVVDGADLGILLNSWGPCAGCAADLNGNGFVNGADLGILLAAFE